MTLLTGFVFYIAVVHIPERFQIVSGDNAVIAGVKFLPMMAGSAVGSFVAGAVNQRRNLTSPIIVIATALQVLGYGLMSSLGDDIGTPKAIYGYQVLVGLGFGLSIASATIMVQINLTSRPQFMGEFHRTNSTEETILIQHSCDPRRPDPGPLSWRQHRARHSCHRAERGDQVLSCAH